MISRTLKASYYTAAGPLMKANGVIHRTFPRRTGDAPRVQLGPGQKRYLQGWINVDANFISGKCDVWADLRNPLPFPDEYASAIYSHHVIEHLPNLSFHFAEMYRCLRPGAAIRVGGPHGDNAIRKFQEGDKGWFGDFPDKRRSIGGRLENFIFCRQEHLTLLTSSFLRELAEDAGFAEITERQPVTDTGFAHLFADALASEAESTPEVPHTLIIEAIKPASPKSP